MGLKKNSPGCNCCGVPSTCLQEDSRTFTGIEISNAGSWTMGFGSASITSANANASFLWASALTRPANPYCWETIPANYRLGTTQPSGDCCRVSWETKSSTSFTSTGLVYTTTSGSTTEHVIEARTSATMSFTLIINSTSVELTFFHFTEIVTRLVNTYISGASGNVLYSVGANGFPPSTRTSVSYSAGYSVPNAGGLVGTPSTMSITPTVTRQSWYATKFISGVFDSTVTTDDTLTGTFGTRNITFNLI